MKFTLAMKHNWLLRKVPNSKYWTVCEKFIWYIDYNNKKHPIIVPVWFETDFGSIPFPFKNIFNPTRYISYILHDKLMYDVKEKKLTRKQADLILIEALSVEWASVIEKLFICIWVRIWAMFRIGKK